ncbi:MAG TPA: 5'/3'-nucleotidase SurE [Elusimicrobia bacterium]|nr:5'/3'-nucleotidase SurE [Elusimicrobiota bacterium]
MKKPIILVTNDDGIHGPGLRPLIAAMQRLGRVVAVVPDQERSADSHCLTLHKPIRVHALGPSLTTVSGSPADCARFGILWLMKGNADLVVSGINRGYNLGEDIIYSGTVAAAREARILGIPAIAFSQEPDAASYAASAACALRLARQTLRQSLPKGVILNVNFPKSRAGKFRGIQAARLGRRIYSSSISRRRDPRGRTHFWLGGKGVKWIDMPGTDVGAIARGFVSVTPLRLDQTDGESLESLRDWRL